MHTNKLCHAPFSTYSVVQRDHFMINYHMLTEQYNYAECKSLNACEVCFDESHTVFFKL